MSHVRSSGHAEMSQPAPVPPATEDGFPKMTYEQRAAPYTTDPEIYRQLAAAEGTKAEATR